LIDKLPASTTLRRKQNQNWEETRC
jgi:hypothetical protein